MVKVGSQTIGSVYFGSKEIVKIYNGQNIVYQKSIPVPTTGGYWSGHVSGGTLTNCTYKEDQKWEYNIDSFIGSISYSKLTGQWILVTKYGFSYINGDGSEKRLDDGAFNSLFWTKDNPFS